jgi:hypothetical protein
VFVSDVFNSPFSCQRGLFGIGEYDSIHSTIIQVLRFCVNPI